MAKEGINYSAKINEMLTDEILTEINEMIEEYNSPDDPPPGNGSDPEDKTSSENRGTIILDATCAPQQISYPQDINLLNEARVNLENIIDSICYEYNYYKPRMYRDNAERIISAWSSAGNARQRKYAVRSGNSYSMSND